MSVLITKADGSKEPFKSEKLRRSLRRAGATAHEVSNIITQTEKVLHDGMKTQEIYRLAFEMLRNSDSPIRARYALRRALFGLGPTGFPFEDYLSRLFTAEGYATKTRVHLQGKCAEHELDVAAYTNDHSFVAEAKFHSSPGVKSDLQVVMYSFARLHDLKEARICQEDICGIKELLVITNTKFTSTATSYAECAGVSLLSWEYPAHNNLHDRIQRAHIYPITVLQSLSPSQKRALIERGIITCNDIVDHPNRLRHAHISQKRTEQVIAEATGLAAGTTELG